MVIHIVRPRETLWGIARHYLGDGSRYPEIQKANPAIRDPSRIYPGQRIRIPDQGPAAAGAQRKRQMGPSSPPDQPRTPPDQTQPLSHSGPPAAGHTRTKAAPQKKATPPPTGTDRYLDQAQRHAQNAERYVNAAEWAQSAAARSPDSARAGHLRQAGHLLQQASKELYLSAAATENSPAGRAHSDLAETRAKAKLLQEEGSKLILRANGGVLV